MCCSVWVQGATALVGGLPPYVHQLPLSGRCGRLVRVVRQRVEDDVEAAIGWLDVDNLGIAMDVDADGAAAGDQQLDEVGDGQPAAGVCGHDSSVP